MHALLISSAVLTEAGKNLSPLGSLDLLSNRLSAESRSNLRASPFRSLPPIQIMRRDPPMPDDEDLDPPRPKDQLSHTVEFVIGSAIL